ncbi:MAG: AAA family ATPase [Candidatus Riflebacteria bacterium]|nr:AAA family ATPase [Candidatus Riflebacteria bacterium]
MAAIKKLSIKKFRGLVDKDIPIGEQLTLISGQNTTFKTTILGMIAQPFGLTSVDTIYGKKFTAKFGDSFKISREYDKPGEHVYTIELDDKLLKKDHIVVKSYARPEKDKQPIRFVAGGKRKTDDGNIDFPVIYLTLKRVFPIGEVSNATEKANFLDEDEANFYIENYNRLMLSGDSNKVSFVSGSSAIKQTLAPTNGLHDGLTISAGQDNLGQIIGSIISFKRAKTSLGNNYKGGLFLIDELDVTLHPAVRERIIDWFYLMSKELDLQIIFTTHALDIIDYIQKRQKNRNCKKTQIVYLNNAFGPITVEENPCFEEITADLKANIYEKVKHKKQTKIDIIFEDEETRLFFSLLTGAKYRKYINLNVASLGCLELAKIAICKAEVLKSHIFCLDGDVKLPKGQNKANILFLPSEKSPERLFKSFLESLDKADDFFVKSQHRYSKMTFRNSIPADFKDTREELKKWFNKEKGRWGGGFKRLFERWSLNNADTIKNFIKCFIECYNYIARTKKIPPIRD